MNIPTKLRFFNPSFDNLSDDFRVRLIHSDNDLEIVNALHVIYAMQFTDKMSVSVDIPLRCSQIQRDNLYRSYQMGESPSGIDMTLQVEGKCNCPLYIEISKFDEKGTLSTEWTRYNP